MESIELFPVTIFKTNIRDNQILKDILVSQILKKFRRSYNTRRLDY
jgi:hypothetical protein